MLPIINILLIVGILLFILYNLYIDTRNWSNTGSFLEGMENAGEQSPESSGSVGSAGSAETAINNNNIQRTGSSQPMPSNVPQNCKTGCIAPTGPNGNCKVIQKDGAEKRECNYGCPNPTFESGDTVNCAYDRDCNSCGTVLFNPDDPPQMSQPGRPAGGVNSLSGIQNAPSVNSGGQTVQGQQQSGQGGSTQQSGQGGSTQQSVQGGSTQQVQQQQFQQVQQVQQQINQLQQQVQQNIQQTKNPSSNSSTLGSMELNIMNSESSPSTVATSGRALFNENIMKQVLENKDLIPSDLNFNNEETSYNLRIGKNFMIQTASIRNFALPNIDTSDYIELGRIIKNIKLREKDPQESDQVQVLYSKLNSYVLELLTDSSLDMTGYDNSGIPTQINNKTRTTGMFGENSNSLLKKTDTDKENTVRHKVKPYDSIWSLYQ